MFGPLDTKTIVLLAAGSFVVALLLVLLLDRIAISRTLQEIRDLPERS